MEMPTISQFRRKSLVEQDPNSADADVLALRHIISVNSELLCRNDDDYLLRSLRCKNYEKKEALNQLLSLEKMKKKYPDILSGIDPEVLQPVLQANIIGLLEGRDDQGSGILYMDNAKWDPSAVTAKDLLKVLILNVENALKDVDMQNNGLVFVIDGSALSGSHLLQMTPKIIRATVAYLEHASAANFKAFYIVKESQFCDLAIRLFLAVFSNAFGKKIKPLGKNMDKLFAVLPKDVVPEDLGGSAEKFDVSNWNKKMTAIDI